MNAYIFQFGEKIEVLTEQGWVSAIYKTPHNDKHLVSIHEFIPDVMVSTIRKINMKTVIKQSDNDKFILIVQDWITPLEINDIMGVPVAEACSKETCKYYYEYESNQ